MALSRNERRKIKAAKEAARLNNLAKLAISARNREQVRDNLSYPVRPERSGCLGNRSVYQGATATHGYVGRNAKSLDYLASGSVAHGFNKG
jgi:hypothetical protein